jgi:hypothetical protein
LRLPHLRGKKLGEYPFSDFFMFRRMVQKPPPLLRPHKQE